MKIYLKNANLINEGRVVNLVLEDGKVTVIDKIDPEALVIDLENKMVIRGFSDVHVHWDKALITDKITNESGTLMEAISIMGPYKKTMTKEDIKDRMRRVLEMSYNNGTRFVRTNIDIDDIIGLKSLEVFNELKEEFKGKMILESVAFPQEGFVDHLENFEYLEKALQNGADVLGGIPATESNPQKHIEMLFDLANKYDVDLDMHIDETDDPNSECLKLLAEHKMKTNFKNKVVAGHCCSLASQEEDVVSKTIEKAKSAEIYVVSLPSTNLYLQGRGDTTRVRRGITPIKKIYENGVKVAIASDNIRDPFNCFGNGNVLQTAYITAHGSHMGGTQDLNNLFDMVSKNGMEIMNQDHKVEGSNFFVVVDAKTPSEAIIGQKGIYAIYEEGKFVQNR